MKHYYTDVPTFRQVALSRHSQAKAIEHGISEEQVADVLMNGTDIPDGTTGTFREKDHVRMVIIRPDPFRGAMLVTTMFRVEPQAQAKR